MRFREIFRFEFAYRLRSPSTWIYAGLLFLMTMAFFLATADGPASAFFNAPDRLAGASLILGLFGMMISAAIFGDAAVRDVSVQMDPLLFTSPIRKVEYLGGRFLAALAINAIIIVAIPLGMFTTTTFAVETVGPFRLLAYLQPFLLFSLPNLVIIGAILFTIGMLTRQVVPLYLTAIGILIGSVVGLNYPGAISHPLLKPLIDPSGLGVLQELVRYWPPAEGNTRLIGFPAVLLWNRAAWLVITAAVLGLLARAYRFAHPDERDRRRPDDLPAVGATSSGPVMVRRIAGSFGWRTTLHQVMAVTRHSLEGIAGSRWAVVVVFASTGFTWLWGHNVVETLFDTNTWPVTSIVAETALTVRVIPFFYLMVALYAGELVWKDREAGTAEILDATPIPEPVSLAGRFLALTILILVLLTAALVGGLLIQVTQGYHDFEFGLYLRIVFGLAFSSYLILAALALAIHVIVDHKYLGHILVVIAMLLPRAVPALGIRHNLLRYGVDPGWTYSDMNGFGPFIGPLAWTRLYWAGWALLLLVAAATLWVRGNERGLARRLRVARARFGDGWGLRTVAATGIALILGAGSFVFYNTNILNRYGDRGATRAAYEERYRRFERSPRPTIVRAELQVEIHPEEGGADLGGTFHLVNHTGVALDSLHLSLDPVLEARSITFDRTATPVLTDAANGYRIWTLERPLQPGDSLAFTFDLTRRLHGFTNERLPTEVVANGTQFDRRWLPFIGYQPHFELTDREARDHFGLAPRPEAPSPRELATREPRGDGLEELVQVSTVIGTAGDQTAITPGVLRRRWTERGRNYFHYETEKPESFGAVILSARYAVREARWKDVPLQIFYHPAHAFDLERMIRGMEAGLEYFSTEFGPYPDTHLRIVEVPRYDHGGSAHPNTITFAEDHFLTRVEGDRFDMAFYGTAHEVAHTWWGGLVTGMPGVRGRGLSEALANYSAMMVTETTYGPEAARMVYDFQMERYLGRRGEEGRDVPLLEIDDQPWIAYGKGAVAFYQLREQIGATAVNTALRRYLTKFGGRRKPYPTSLDLYAELRAVTPDSVRTLLADLFEQVTLWEVRTDSARVEPTGTGAFRVTMAITGRKVRGDVVGNESEVPMNDLVEIGLYAPGAGDARGERIYLRKHRIVSGRQTITIIVPSAPALAGVDPENKLIDRTREDNFATVSSTAP